jgi:diaminopimelate epimerase
MEFTKMQGAGNDFVVIKTRNNRHDWSDLVTKMCDRHYGIGADGLLISLPSKVADFKMRIFNADGSESAVCGNGLRCLVRYYLDNNPDRNDSTITIETSIGLRTAKISRRKGIITDIRVNMGEPTIGLDCTPVKEVVHKYILDITTKMNHVISVEGQELLLSLISIGNPHAVYFHNGKLADFPLAKLGSKVEQHKLFPDETNFEVVRIINRQRVEALVWERGVGETLACGSGACAIVVAGNLLGWLEKKVDVILPGGTLKVNWDVDTDTNIYLSGPTATIFRGEW